MALDERMKRFKALAEKMPESIARYRAVMKEKVSKDLINRKQCLFDNWNQAESVFDSLRSISGDDTVRDTFLSKLDKAKAGYIETVQGLDNYARITGTAWLQGIVDEVNTKIMQKLPLFR